MRVIPVLDLKQGQVVRGVGGQRNAYQKVQSVLTPLSTPGGVAQAFAKLGFRAAYVADLDAIGGGAPQWEAYTQIAAAGLKLLLDAGVGSRDAARELLAHAPPETRMIIGLESLAGPEALAALCAIRGAERWMFSLDLVDGRPKAVAAWSGRGPLEIAILAYEQGLRSFIVLDVAQVGTSRGCSTLELCAALRARLGRDVELISGGGVRGPEDLAALAACGCNGALVASALHDGRIGMADLRSYG